MARHKTLAIIICLQIFSGCTSPKALHDVEEKLFVEGNDIQIWHTFASGSVEERTFLDSIELFQNLHPEYNIEVTMVPFGNAEQLFMTAAQGGEAPDLIRLSNDHLGKLGDVKIDGYPLLEDLRIHLSPVQMSVFDNRSIEAMRYDGALYGLPSSQDCLSLIWNRALFSANGESEPNENWTTSDLLNAAMNLTYGEVQGLALPIKVEYWWFPFQTGFGGSLFDKQGLPTLDSNGSAESMSWMINLEKEHGVVAVGTQRDSMKTQFQEGKAAMIIDGPWNWVTYETSRIDSGQTLLPTVDSTGLRMSPLVTYKGWSVSKQSTSKVASIELALFLSSSDVQKKFALDTYTMPTAISLVNDSDISSSPVIRGFLSQVELGTPAPTTKGMSLIYGPLSTAFEQVYSGVSDSQVALEAANAELEELMRVE